jgi:hypothetical protein
MADIDITFSNGSRVFTPTNPPSAPQLGDVNNDGEIDILDAGDVNAFQLTDVNNDGVIDILDAAEVLAQGPGGIIVNVPPPTLTPPNPFDSPKTCPEGQELTIIPIGNGITTTGCTSIPTEPPIPGIGQDPWTCPPGKVRGFGFDYDNPVVVPGFIGTPQVVYPIKLFGCTCAEASVNVAEVAVLIASAAWVASRKAAKAGIEQALIQANKYKDELNSSLQKCFKRIDRVNLEIGKWDDIAEDIRLAIDDFDPNFESPAVLKELQIDLRNAEAKKGTAVVERMATNLAINNITTLLDQVMARINDLLKSLDELLTVTDPSALATLILGGLLPINFIVPKECGDFSRLDDQCNCVPISSGSYSYSSLTNYNFKNKDYTIIENL